MSRIVYLPSFMGAGPYRNGYGLLPETEQKFWGKTQEYICGVPREEKLTKETDPMIWTPDRPYITTDPTVAPAPIFDTTVNAENLFGKGRSMSVIIVVSLVALAWLIS